MTGEAQPPESEGSTVASIAKRVLPWIIAAGLIGYVFSRVPIEEAWDVARHADLPFFLAVVLGSVVVWFLLESALYSFLFTRFNAAVSFPEARALRGMSYLLTPIHWNLGKAAVILRLRRTKNIPLLESTSTVMFYQAMDGVILGGLATLGVSLLPQATAGHEAFPEIRHWTVGLILITVLNLLVLRSRWPRFRGLTWWREISIHQAHRRFEAYDVLFLLSGKFVYHGLYVIAFYMGMRAFGVDLPFALVLAATPIVQAVGALPVTPAGLGTQQAAMLYFYGGRFGGDASEAAVVAFGFSFPVALILARCLLGLFYLKDLSASRAANETPTPILESD